MSTDLPKILIDMIDEDEEDEELSNQIYDCLLQAGSNMVAFILTELSKL